MEKPKPRKILDDKYIVKKRIGKGTQGEVFLVNKIDDNKEYVVKLINLSSMSPKAQNLFMNEIEVLKKLRSSNNEHNYVPYIYDYGKGFLKKEGEENNNLIQRLYSVIEYERKRDLFYYIKMTPGGFKEKYAKLIFKKILEGIQYCHEKNICHLDIKIGNILLNERFVPIITDFGFSQEIFDSNGIPFQKNEIVGTPQYVCPQMWEKKIYTGIEADIFSLGVVLFNLVTGKFGFLTSYKKDKFYSNILKRNYEIYWNDLSKEFSFINELSKEFKDLYLQMISYNQENRPKIKDIFNHPWMKEINDMNEEQLNELNEEVIEEFLRLEDKKNDLNETIQSDQTSASTANYNSNRGEEEKAFDNNIPIKKIKNGDKFANHFIKIVGKIDPYVLMNNLFEKIQNKYKMDCEIEKADDKLKLILNFDLEQQYDIENEEIPEEINNTCCIKIKLYEDEPGGYLINFIKIQGNIQDYYERFLEIKEIIKNL